MHSICLDRIERIHATLRTLIIMSSSRLFSRRRSHKNDFKIDLKWTIDGHKKDQK